MFLVITNTRQRKKKNRGVCMNMGVGGGGLTIQDHGGKGILAIPKAAADADKEHLEATSMLGQQSRRQY